MRIDILLIILPASPVLSCAADPAKIQAASTTLGTCRALFDYNVSVIQVTEVEILGFARCDRAQQCPAIR